MAAANPNPRPVAAAAACAAVGIDVGGTKVAAGLVDIATGGRRRAASRCGPGRSAAAPRCSRTARGSRGARRRAAAGGDRAVRARRPRRAAGQRRHSRLARARRRGGDRRARASSLESDVRAAALAEARFGAGAGASPFLFVVVGTGASACLVVDGRPYAGARGEALVLGAPPVELLASGPALARAAGLERAEDVVGDPAHATLVDDAAAQLGGRARGLRQRARPVARRPRRRAGCGSPRSGYASSVRSGSAWRTRALRRWPLVASSLGGGRRGGRSGARCGRRPGVRLARVLDETGLWRDVVGATVVHSGDVGREAAWARSRR